MKVLATLLAFAVIGLLIAAVVACGTELGAPDGVQDIQGPGLNTESPSPTPFQTVVATVRPTSTRSASAPSSSPAKTSPAAAAAMFTECIPEDLYHYLLNTGYIDDLEDLSTINWFNLPDQGVRGTTYVPEVCTSLEVVMTASDPPQIYNDNILVLPVAEDLLSAGWSIPFSTYAHRFYEYFDDAFDFLIFAKGLYQFENQNLITGVNPSYSQVSNDVRGIGQSIFSGSKRYGSAGRLQGIVRLPAYRIAASQWILSHELMHRWGNHITPHRSSHWSFMSGDGMLGGFHIADLLDIGEGRYAVRGGWRGGGQLYQL